MPRYVAFLRGMNLGGRRITNDDLRAAFEGLELTDVATFRASGNVIFDGPDGVGGADVSAKIEAGLADALGYEVPVFLRTCEQVAKIAAREPFPAAEVARRRPASSRSPCCPTRPASSSARRRSAWPPTRTASRSRAPSSTGCRAAASAKPTSTSRPSSRTSGPWTMRTMGTVEQIAAKHCA